MSSRDVVIVSDLFGCDTDLSIYNDLLHELENSGNLYNCICESKR